MATNWVREAKNFDDQYTEATPLSMVPFFGKYVKNDLQFRQEMVLNFLGDVEGKHIIDIGCGVGRISHELASRGATITGYDISPEAIDLANDYARKFKLDDRCKFHVADLSADMTFPKADCWIALGVWQYLEDPEKTLKKLVHIPEFISDVPTRNHWINPLRKVYRTWMKGIWFRSYSKQDAYNLFNRSGIYNVEINDSNPTILLVSRKAAGHQQTLNLQ